MIVYHHTDIAHWPWIAASRALQPTNSQAGGYPQDVLWFTANPEGDRTATCCQKDSMAAFRTGGIARVRVSIDSAHVRPWREVLAEMPEWTPAKIERLEMTAQRMGQMTHRWFARREPFLIADAIAVEARMYLTGWEQIDAISQGEGPKRMIRALGRIFMIQQQRGAQNQLSYAVRMWHESEAHKIEAAVS